jgi:hypothetical protein
MGHKEEQGSKDDRKSHNDRIIEHADKFHQGCKIPHFEFLNFMGHMDIKGGCWMIMDKKY